MGKQNKQKKQETKKRNEFGLLSRQLQRFEEACPGSVAEETKSVLIKSKPNVNYYEDQSEETTPYPSEWPQKKGLKTAEKRLNLLWLQLFAFEDEDPQSPQASSSGDRQNHRLPEHRREDGDGDIDMRSNAGTSETRDSSRWREPSANFTSNSGTRTESSGRRETSTSTNLSTRENTYDSSGSNQGSSSTNPSTGGNRSDSSGSNQGSSSTNPGPGGNTDSSGSNKGSSSTNPSTGGNRSDSSGSNQGSSSTNPGPGGNRTSSGSSEPEGDHWPLFTSKIKGSNRWIPIKSECRLYGCDFADISFRCELYCKLEEPGASEDQLINTARNFMQKCPAALATLDDMYSQAGISSYRSYRDTHQRPRQPNSLTTLDSQHEGSGRHDSSLRTDELEQDRQQIGVGRELRDPPSDWQDIELVRDPDIEGQVKVRGKIQLLINYWADVSLPSLNPDNPDMERHVLVKQADYKEYIKRFAEVAEDKKPKLIHKTGDDGESLNDLPRDAVKIMYYTSARQTFVDTWPVTYAVGYIINGPDQKILPWARGLCGRKWGATNINDEIHQDRQKVGQPPIVVVPRYRRR